LRGNATPGADKRSASLHCTVSVGITAASQERLHARQLIEHPDAALYRAKKAGKNRTVVFVQYMGTSLE
jgi:diguanylate cyclase (GGDEF)-like protein